MTYIPAPGEFVLVTARGCVLYAGRAVNVDRLTQRATVRRVGEGTEPELVPFAQLEQHPLMGLGEVPQ